MSRTTRIGLLIIITFWASVFLAALNPQFVLPGWVSIIVLYVGGVFFLWEEK